MVIQPKQNVSNNLTFYARLKELELQPRRIKQKTHLLVKEAVELVHYLIIWVVAGIFKAGEINSLLCLHKLNKAK